MPSFEKSAASGLWSVRFREVQADGTTKNARLTKNPKTGEKFRTRKAAQFGYEDYLAEKTTLEASKPSGGVIAPTSKEMSVKELYGHFLPYKKQRTKESSHYDFRKKFETKILPFFGEMAAKDVTPALILDWLGGLSDYSKNYRRDLLTILGSLFRFGEKYHGIANPVRLVDRPRDTEPQKEMQIWSPEEFGRFFSQIGNPTFAAYFAFLYFSGCRRGEACAVTWADLDLEACTVKVSKSITAKAHDEGKTYSVTSTKTKRSRTVALPSALCSYLAHFRADHCSDAPPDAFAFGTDRPLPFSSIERVFRAATEAAEVKRIRIHDLRHSCASVLIQSGVSIVAVSRHLGHRNIEETLNTYAHMLPDDDERIRAAVNSVSKKIELCT